MNSLYNTKDTIAALATPIGIGGIAVIRICGFDAFFLVDKIFFGIGKITNAEPYTIHYGTIKNIKGTILDSVLVSVFKSPHSYTGNDVVEISCHGGYYVSQTILAVLYEIGARPAEPGEFTLRAYLNGKLDLAQAEAVADLIHAKTEKAHKASIDQLHGRLSKYTVSLRQEILDICSLLELELDFSQEGVELTNKDFVIFQLNSIRKKIGELISTFSNGRHMREGVRVALVGKPNVGKSSLMNSLLKEERSIVSHLPGTTRDTIEESINIDGFEFIFTDTAGLRESIDIIEQEGIKRTNSVINSSDVLAFVVDSSCQLSPEDVFLFRNIQSTVDENTITIFIFNKNDVLSESFKSSLKDLKGEKIFISCKTGQGISDLKELLKLKTLPYFDSTATSVVINNLRHKVALENALRGIDMAIESMQNHLSGEFASVDLRGSLDCLGEIIGITTPDDILNNIFGNFCIGK